MPTEVMVEKHQVVKMTDLVSYQKETINSTDILKKQCGGVTLYAFDKDERLNDHIVPHDAVAYIIDGEAEVVIAGKPHAVGAGEMIIMPAGKPHAIRALKRFKMVLTRIKEEG